MQSEKLGTRDTGSAGASGWKSRTTQRQRRTWRASASADPTGAAADAAGVEGAAEAGSAAIPASAAGAAQGASPVLVVPGGRARRGRGTVPAKSGGQQCGDSSRLPTAFCSVFWHRQAADVMTVHGALQPPISCEPTYAGTQNYCKLLRAGLRKNHVCCMLLSSQSRGPSSNSSSSPKAC